MKKTKKLDNDLVRWCEILSQSAIPPEKVPDGWHTVADIAEKTGKAIVTTSERVRKLVRDGLAERKDFRIQLEQRVRPVPHYRLK